MEKYRKTGLRVISLIDARTAKNGKNNGDDRAKSNLAVKMAAAFLAMGEKTILCDLAQNIVSSTSIEIKFNAETKKNPFLMTNGTVMAAFDGKSRMPILLETALNKMAEAGFSYVIFNSGPGTYAEIYAANASTDTIYIAQPTLDSLLYVEDMENILRIVCRKRKENNEPVFERHIILTKTLINGTPLTEEDIQALIHVPVIGRDTDPRSVAHRFVLAARQVH